MSNDNEPIRAVQTADGTAIVKASLEAQANPDREHLNTYICEVCDKQEDLTEEEAYQSGWDYPPFMGAWGILTPRTCPNCTIEKTAYWAVITEGTQNLSERHRATIHRVIKEAEEHGKQTPTE